MLFTNCFAIHFFFIVLAFSQKTEWTSSDLIKYVQDNKASINPNETEYYFIDPNSYIASESNCSSLISLLSSIYDK